MQYRRGKREVLVRLDPGDEVMGALKEICRKEKIGSAYLSGIGAARSVEIAHYDTKAKKYSPRRFEGMLEITSLTGNISMMDGQAAPHIHATVGLEDFSCAAGHLISAEISVTCEIVMVPLEMKVEREFDAKTGLNLQRF